MKPARKSKQRRRPLMQPPQEDRSLAIGAASKYLQRLGRATDGPTVPVIGGRDARSVTMTVHVVSAVAPEAIAAARERRINARVLDLSPAIPSPNPLPEGERAFQKTPGLAMAMPGQAREEDHGLA